MKERDGLNKKGKKSLNRIFSILEREAKKKKWRFLSAANNNYTTTIIAGSTKIQAATATTTKF